jgi:hypothetical protein
MEIPKPKSIIVWGILVLEENNAAAKTIAKNIGIIYSRVRVFPPPPLRTVTVLLVEEEEEGVAAVAAATIIVVIVSAISAIAILIL